MNFVPGAEAIPPISFVGAAVSCLKLAVEFGPKTNESNVVPRSLSDFGTGQHGSETRHIIFKSLNVQVVQASVKTLRS